MNWVDTFDGDDIPEGLQAWIGVEGHGVLTRAVLDNFIESGIPGLFTSHFELPLPESFPTEG